MLETQRHELILKLLEEQGTVSLHVLIDEVGASEATLRRDLIKLAERNELKQVRGGAVSMSRQERPVRRLRLSGSSFNNNMEKEVAAKRAIAKCAAKLCEDGEAVIINGGTTTYYMGEFLRDKELSILTNSLALGVGLIESSANRVMFPAGEASRKLNFILNPLDDTVTDAFRASKYFLSSRAVSHRGVMEADPLVALAEQRLSALAEETILLVDATKIGQSSSYASFELSRIDKVITDDRVRQQDLDLFADNNVEVVIVERIKNQTNAERKA